MCCLLDIRDAFRAAAVDFSVGFQAWQQGGMALRVGGEGFALRWFGADDG